MLNFFVSDSCFIVILKRVWSLASLSCIYMFSCFLLLLKSLASFEYVEPNGKDMGINVRKKAENIVALLNNKEKIQEVREKASANRDK